MGGFIYPEQSSQCERITRIDFASDYYGGVEGLISRTRVSAGYNIHGTPFHMVGVNVGGTVRMLRRYEDRSQIQDFRPGDMLLSPVGRSLESAHPQTTDALYIYLNPRFIEFLGQTIGAEQDATVLRSELGKHDPAVQHIGFSLARELQILDGGSKLLIKSLMTQLAVHLIRNYGQAQAQVSATPRGDRRDQIDNLRNAVEFIHAHLHEDISLSAIAATEHLSPYHFSRRFKQQYGLSPHQYVIRQRVAKAEQLLKNTRLTVGEIALMVGFTDHSHLTRHFKRITGKTPRHA